MTTKMRRVAISSCRLIVTALRSDAVNPTGAKRDTRAKRTRRDADATEMAAGDFERTRGFRAARLVAPGNGRARPIALPRRSRYRAAAARVNGNLPGRRDRAGERDELRARHGRDPNATAPATGFTRTARVTNQTPAGRTTAIGPRVAAARLDSFRKSKTFKSEDGILTQVENTRHRQIVSANAIFI